MTQIAENFSRIQKQIRNIAQESGRNPEDVRLVAVSKKQPADKIQAALDGGHRLFGENRVQEAYDHWQDLKPSYPDLALHLIGPLQTNKVKDAVGLFDCIETLDRPKLARTLAEEMDSQARNLPCFIQVNTGEEDQKSGVIPDDLPDFITLCRDLKLNITGLMCIPPQDDPPAVHFAFLRKLATEHGLEHLSMGMSADYRKAIPLGATHIRLGTALFGQRQGA